MAEAARLVKSEGTIAFTDWVEGPTGLTEVEAERLLKFMKFPGIQSLDGYAKLLEENQCVVQVCEDTGRFPPAVDLYLNMLDNQLTYDALRIIGFDMKMMQGLAAEMQFMRELAYARKLVQGVFVAVRR
jgi:hypothetical protein